MGQTGYSFGVGFLDGIRTGHGIKSSERQQDRADTLVDMRKEQIGRANSRQDVADERAATTFDNQQADRETKEAIRKAQQQALRFKKAVYDDAGNLKPAAKWDRSVLADIGNKMEVTRRFLADNPEVDPDSPLLEIRPIRVGDDEKTSKEKLTFRLNRTDGGTGVLTEDRTSGPDAKVLSLDPEEFIGEMKDVFAGYGVDISGGDGHGWDREKIRLESESAQTLERVKGEETRKTEKAKGIVKQNEDDLKYSFEDLPDDLQAMLGDPVTDQVTGKTEIVLDQERVGDFLSFWQNSGVKDPRKAMATYQDYDKVRGMSAADIKAQLDGASQQQRQYLVSLMNEQQRAELRKLLQGESGSKQALPAGEMMPSHGTGMQ